MSSANPSPAPLRLVVGLGNPGLEYRETRHNVGFAVVERIAAEHTAPFRLEKAWRAEVAKAGDLLLCKPLTYMNLSGEAVRAVCQFYKIAPEETLTVLDDMSLPLGKLRLREGGSAGGHNGLKSIIAQLGTSAVPRLRLGIGTATGPDAAVGHVLGRFAPAEKETVGAGIGLAVDAIECVRRNGLQRAMNTYN